MRSKLPEIRSENLIYIQNWCEKNLQDWIEQLNNVKDRYQHLVRSWNFSEETMILLRQYLSGNQILVAYLDSEVVNQDVKSNIEDTLLLPIAEIEKRNREKVESGDLPSSPT